MRRKEDELAKVTWFSGSNAIDNPAHRSSDDVGQRQRSSARRIEHAPEWFATAPVGATRKVLEKSGWTVDSVDLWEVNEAFAVAPMALMRELQIPHERVNVNGGACALRHPIGASGARIIVTLVHALQARGHKRGLATLCIGGGEATAVALELV